MDPKKRRRRHSAQLKEQVLTECDEPGASVAAVAHSHGLNDNLVHKWRRRREQAKAALATNGDAGAVSAAAAFVALQLPAPPMPATVPDIRIELRRGATTMNISWPSAAASECAAWLREWLR